VHQVGNQYIVSTKPVKVQQVQISFRFGFFYSWNI